MISHMLIYQRVYPMISTIMSPLCLHCAPPKKISPWQVVPREHDLQEVGVQTGQTGVGVMIGRSVESVGGLDRQEIQWDIDIWIYM